MHVAHKRLDVWPAPVRIWKIISASRLDMPVAFGCSNALCDCVERVVGTRELRMRLKLSQPPCGMGSRQARRD